MNARAHLTIRPPHRRPLALLVACVLGALLGACGSGLYDATGVPLLEGSGNVCNETSQVVCAGVCTEEDAAHCGASCTDCTAAGGIPPRAAAACVHASGATAGTGTCGFECTEGLLRCSTGCCPATAVAAGERFTCALANDGSVSCWGANEGGQLGDGTSAARAAPGRVALPGAATAIGAGSAHACAIVGGAVRCWGANDAGQVTGSVSAAHHTEAATPVTSRAVAVAAGAGHTCALLDTGAVRCWGAPAQIGDREGDPHVAGATALAAGANHTCALVAGGAVQCWGANTSGQLGRGAVSTGPTPLGPVVTAAGTPLAGMELLAASAGQTCAATRTGTIVNGLDAFVWCWGDSLGDALGGTSDFRMAVPQPSATIPAKDPDRSTIRNAVQLLAVGRKHVCVSDRGEAIECFGSNDRGQLGASPTEPVEAATVPLPARPSLTTPVASAIAAGADHACAIVPKLAEDEALGAGGRLRCWGANDAGQLGNGATTDPGTGSIVTPLGR